MYHTYTTDGIVLQSISVGDANRRLLIFTKEFGLIYADVQSVRGHMSKLRPLIQNFSKGMFTLVRGKYGWKLINALPEGNYFYDRNTDFDRAELLGRAHALIVRFVGREDVVDDVLYDVFTRALELMMKKDKGQAEIIESLMTCRILRRLGFLTDDGLPKEIMSPYSNFSEAVMLQTAPLKGRINSRINTALRESGLV